MNAELSGSRDSEPDDALAAELSAGAGPASGRALHAAVSS